MRTFDFMRLWQPALHPAEVVVRAAIMFVFTVVGLDRLVSEARFRRKRAADVIEGRVVQLVRGGAIDRGALASVHISEDEMLARVRNRGRERLEDIEDAWFERSGDVTIVFRST